jgi:hypothetical protein
MVLKILCCQPDQQHGLWAPNRSRGSSLLGSNHSNGTTTLGSSGLAWLRGSEPFL